MAFPGSEVCEAAGLAVSSPALASLGSEERNVWAGDSNFDYDVDTCAVGKQNLSEQFGLFTKPLLVKVVVAVLEAG